MWRRIRLPFPQKTAVLEQERRGLVLRTYNQDENTYFSSSAPCVIQSMEPELEIAKETSRRKNDDCANETCTDR